MHYGSDAYNPRLANSNPDWLGAVNISTFRGPFKSHSRQGPKNARTWNIDFPSLFKWGEYKGQCSKLVKITFCPQDRTLSELTLENKTAGVMIMLHPTVVSNRTLYWFKVVGSETVFYSNRCYQLPDWLLPRSNCYFAPNPTDTLCVPRSYCYFPPKPPDTPSVIMWSICQHCFP